MNHIIDDDLDDHKLNITIEDEHTVRQSSYRSDRLWTIDSKALGTGSYGNVRLHQSTSGEKRAVKAVLKSMVERCDIDYKQEIRTLAKFSKAKVFSPM